MNREYIAFSGTVADNYDQYMGPIFFEPYATDLVKNNGQLVFNIWNALKKNPASDLAYKAIMEFFKKDSSFFSVPFSIHNDGELKKLLQDAGFNNIDIHYTTILAEADSALTIAKAL